MCYLQSPYLLIYLRCLILNLNKITLSPIITMAYRLATQQQHHVYELPNYGSVRGLNLSRTTFPLVFAGPDKVCEYRLKRGDDVLLASYPRTGKVNECYDKLMNALLD